MKFKYTRFYPLSLALAALPITASHGQDVETPPVEVVEETVLEESGTASDAVDQEVVQARQRLEDTKKLAETATGDGKARAFADVEDAEKRLNAALERKRGNGEQETGSKQEQRNRDNPPEAADAADQAGEDSKEAGVDDSGAPPRRMRPEEQEKAGKERPGSDGADQAAEEEGRDPNEPALSDEKPKTEPEIPPETAVEPEAAVETKEEVKETKEADQAVDLTTQQVEKEANRRKLELKDEGDARDLIRDLIGSESEVSKAEATRETRLAPRFRGDDRESRRGEKRDEIGVASDFLLRQLSGKAMPGEAPAFFRRTPEIDPRPDLKGERVERTVLREQAQPRYFHEGRRYVRFDSRNSVPAILLAAAALDRVLVQPANRTDGYFPADQQGNYYANELPPENFRGNDAVVVSYPVSKSSMISSNDIIFAQGSTRFADGHSYDMVMALAGAMANPALNDARFVIEGHASAEGSYEGNMALSQRRAEAIVRDMVREGIDPERLIPVGYGESEARYPAGSQERLRSLDRNVRVFRTGAE